MLLRVIQFAATYLIVQLAFLINRRISENMDLIRGRAAMGQVSNDPVVIAATRDLQRHEYGTFFVWVIATLVIILIWAVPALIKRWRLRRAERRVFGS